LRKTHVNTKTSQFSPFFGFQELRKKHVTTKTSQFSPFFGFQELRKHVSKPKIVNFPHFSDSRSYIYIYVNTKTNQFSPFFGFQELRKKTFQHQNSSIFLIFEIPGVEKKNTSTPKLVNFPHFLDSRS